jgi:hypothetical protein
MLSLLEVHPLPCPDFGLLPTRALRQRLAGGRVPGGFEDGGASPLNFWWP